MASVVSVASAASVTDGQTSRDQDVSDPPGNPTSPKRTKKRKKRRRSGMEKGLTEDERASILTKRARKQRQISENMRMNAWKLACANEKLFRKTEFHRVPTRGTDQYNQIKREQYKILNDVWQQACVQALDTGLKWVTAEDIGLLVGVKVVDLTPDQVKLKETMKTDAYKNMQETCKQKIKQMILDRGEKSAALAKQMWEKAIEEYGAADAMKDLPSRTTAKFKKLSSNEDWKKKFDDVNTRYKQLVQTSS